MPEGSKIALARLRNNNFDIYVMNADASGQKRFTKKGHPTFIPAWSLDGTKIAFSTFRNGDRGVFVKARSEGRTNRRKNLSKNEVVIAGQRGNRSPRKRSAISSKFALPDT